MIFIKIHEILYSILLYNNLLSWIIGLILLWRPLYFLQINFSRRYSSFSAIKIVRIISIIIVSTLLLSFYFGIAKFQLGNKLFIYFLELLIITEFIGGLFITLLRQLFILLNIFTFIVSKYFGFSVQALFLLFEIYLLSTAYSFFFIKHTDLVFNNNIIIVYNVVTYGLYLYALIISLAVWILTQGLNVKMYDIYIDDFFESLSIKALIVIVPISLLIGSFYGFFKSSNNALRKNDGYGILNTTSDLDVIPILNDYLDIAQKINVDNEELDKDTAATKELMEFYSNQVSKAVYLLDTLQNEIFFGMTLHLLKKDSKGLYEYIDYLLSQDESAPNIQFDNHNSFNLILFTQMEFLEKHPEIENLIKMQYNSLDATKYPEKWRNIWKNDLMIADIYYASKYGYNELANTLFEHYYHQISDRYEIEPIISLYGFIKLAQILNYADKHHKAEKVLIRSQQLYAANRDIFNENYGLASRTILSASFDNITEILLTSISFQRLDSELLLDLINNIINKDKTRKDQLALAKTPNMNKENLYFNYINNIKPHYEVAMHTIARYIDKYPAKVSDIENILLSLIERNKSRWYNYSLDVNWIETPPKMINDECGINYMNSEYHILGQYYDKDTTINFSFKKYLDYLEDGEIIEVEVSELWFNTEIEMSIFLDVENNFINLRNNLIPEIVGQRLSGKSLLISTDGFLQEIPFQYLLKDVPLNSITHIPGFSSYIRKTIKEKNNLLAVSVPKPNFIDNDDDILLSYTRDYDPDNLNAGTLVFAQKESKYISTIAAEYLAGQSIYKNNPSESWVTQNIANYDILHFSTHSSNYLSTYKDCGILLNKDKNSDGFLSGQEIEEISLSGQLVFLSGCESGTGEYEIGEGTASIARSFLSAGASEIIATLWRVNDESIFELSKIFYKYYFNGYTASQAVYLAQEEFKQDHPTTQFPLIYISN